MFENLSNIGRRSLKSSAAPISWWLRHCARSLGAGGGAQVIILAYHRIVADIVRAEEETIFGMVTSTETFRRQMILVREHSEVLTLTEAAAVLRGERRIERPAVVITFDDGYLDVYEQAWPILRELGLPATIFVPTACIGAGQLLDHDRLYQRLRKAHLMGLSLRVPLEKARLGADQVAKLCADVDPLRVTNQLNNLPFTLRTRVLNCLDEFMGESQSETANGFSLMDWKKVREMAGNGISFGAHTERHVILTLEDEQTVECEIVRCKQALEEKIGQLVRHFAYPTGRYNAAIRNITEWAGYETAVTTERRINRPGDDLFTLGRVSLCEESTRGITGKYSEAVARLRMAV